MGGGQLVPRDANQGQVGDGWAREAAGRPPWGCLHSLWYFSFLDAPKTEMPLPGFRPFLAHEESETAMHRHGDCKFPILF